MAGQFALADSTTDIVDALVSKGVLTEEEGKLISKGAKSQKEAQDKSIKGKLSISSALDNATLYGDVRARYEFRNIDRLSTSATYMGKNYESNRSRYKATLGFETKAGDWYTDLAIAAGVSGRSDNVTFGDAGIGGVTEAGMSPKDKQAVYFKRAMVGWNATPWLAIEAGRMKNPLYMVNSMVFDHDIVMEGAQEKLKFTVGETNLFANLGQWVYTGYIQNNDVTGTTKRQNMILAFQAGAQQAFNSNTSAKAAIGYYDYTGNIDANSGNFKPFVGNNDSVALVASTGMNYGATNDLGILDVLGEFNYMATSNIGIRPYAEYAYNTKGSARYDAACAQSTSTVDGNAANFCAGNDDNAWLVGIAIGSAKDLKSFEGKKMAKGDWSANLWYQSVGTYALDVNAVDTDIFDGRVNMEGTSLKAQYNIADNVMFNFTGAWGQRKNNKYGTTYTKADLTINGDDFELYQFDVTYKF
jgi:polyhydroxyalkanoate synthesis regulator phasin